MATATIPTIGVNPADNHLSAEATEVNLASAQDAYDAKLAAVATALEVVKAAGASGNVQTMLDAATAHAKATSDAASALRSLNHWEREAGVEVTGEGEAGQRGRSIVLTDAQTAARDAIAYFVRNDAKCKAVLGDGSNRQFIVQDVEDSGGQHGFVVRYKNVSNMLRDKVASDTAAPSGPRAAKTTMFYRVNTPGLERYYYTSVNRMASGYGVAKGVFTNSKGEPLAFVPGTPRRIINGKPESDADYMARVVSYHTTDTDKDGNPIKWVTGAPE